MTAKELLQKLSECDVRITLQDQDQDLRISGRKEALNADLISQIKEKKAEIVRHLQPKIKDQDDSSYFKVYEYPDGSVLKLTKEEFDRVVEAVKLLQAMRDESARREQVS